MFIIQILFLLQIIPCFIATSEWEEFTKFMIRYKKKYSSNGEQDLRFDIFRKNLRNVEQHNKRNDSTFTMKINHFSDLHPEEFKSQYIGNGIQLSDKTTKCLPFIPLQKNMNDTVDWRTNNAVTPVKNQGQCGSCWAFSSTGAMEGAWYIAKNKRVSLSEQQLIDCSKKYDNKGCHGGLMDNAFLFTIDNAICSEEEYPYTASSSVAPSCKKCSPISFFTNCYDVEANNQIQLQYAVSMTPVSIAIEADTTLFQSYSSGVITDETCGTNLDHGVLIVGYGIESNIPYWLVKNSWGTEWGDEGYVKIKRSSSTNDKGICGIAMTPSFPTV
jgi:C1A family cysteine protease